jgi:hypothetical protein
MAAEFPSYYHSMDREYFKEGELPALGISTPPFEDQLAALKVRIRQGVTGVELGFTGAGKGNMAGKQTTPEMYGKEEREAIRELAKINRVQLSTHATVGVMGLAGMGEGGFSRQQAQQTLHEIEKAIDFAADTAQGGAVVVHTGEWIRPVSSAGKEFQGYPHEADKATIYLADEKTGKMMAINKEDIVWEPVKKNGKVEYKEEDGIQRIQLAPRTFKQIVDEEKGLSSYKPEDKKTDEELFISHHFANQRIEAEAHARRWALDAEQSKNEMDRLKAEQDALMLMSDSDFEQEKARIAHKAGMRPEDLPENFNKNMRIAALEKQKQHAKQAFLWTDDAAKSYGAQAKEIERRTTELKSMEHVGLVRSAETLSRAAMFAYQETQDKHLEKPLFVAPEAWQPEHWGSHPIEMQKLIEAGREQMAKELVGSRGMSQEEAKKVASQHIKATFDVGHAYTWRKFFEPKEGESMQETDKRFNKWLLKSVGDLAKQGIIGHVHLSDNFGYHDEHLTPGMGKAPIKEFMEEMKKAGVDVGKAIVEPAHQDIRALHGAMGHLGSPVYGLGKWSDVEQSYFGKTQPPYFTTEAFMPVQREWQVSYFGIPFE